MGLCKHLGSLALLVCVCVCVCVCACMCVCEREREREEERAVYELCGIEGCSQPSKVPGGKEERSWSTVPSQTVERRAKEDRLKPMISLNSPKARLK